MIKNIAIFALSIFLVSITIVGAQSQSSNEYPFEQEFFCLFDPHFEQCVSSVLPLGCSGGSALVTHLNGSVFCEVTNATGGNVTQSNHTKVTYIETGNEIFGNIVLRQWEPVNDITITKIGLSVIQNGTSDWIINLTNSSVTQGIGGILFSTNDSQITNVPDTTYTSGSDLGLVVTTAGLTAQTRPAKVEVIIYYNEN